MVYWDVPGRLRGQLFHRKPGDFDRAHADCSQFGASILHWCGNTKVSDSDSTGTLWNKGHVLTAPKAACGIIFGEFPGVHFVFATEHEDGVWYCVGFGSQTGPDRVSLPDLETYFKDEGHPGVRFLDFAA